MDIGERFAARDAAEWRAWLEENHASKPDIWLVLQKKGMKAPGVRFEQAVEEALCFGWVDSQMKSIDHQSYALRFSPRRRSSRWSASNRALAAQLVEEGRMAQAGFAVLPSDLQAR